MKKQLFLLAVALFAIATAVRAQTLVQINSSTFPDSNFRNIVKGKDIDKDQDGMLSMAERLAVTELYVEKKGIQNLKGIEFFTALEILYCYENQLTSLDLSKNSALTELFCYNNKLTSLDVSKNTALTVLSCYYNQLTSLDVSKNTALTMLYCYDNKLTSLDLTNNKALTTLYCYLNQIGHSDMLKLVNSLPTVTNGNFCGISISSSSEKNVLAKSSADIAKGKGWNVQARDGSSNVDYTGTDYLIAIKSTNFPDDKFRSIVAGTSINKDSDGYLSEEEIAAVTKLDIIYKNIASLKGIEFFAALEELYCEGNQLASLDVSKNTALTELDCAYNQLTSLDVSKNTALNKLYCEGNQLASLDVSKNTALTELDCYGNQLASLDVSKNTALTELNCYENQLVSLNVSKNTALRYLYCRDNQLTSLDVSKNTALTELGCSRNQLTSLDVSKNTALVYLGCYNNQIKDDQMQALVNSLPTVTGGKFYVIDTKDSNEQNVCTRDQVAIASGKGWKVYDSNGGSSRLYAGSGPDIAINATNFPDENFRNFVAGTDIDKDADGYLSDEEIAAVTKLLVNEKNIASLKGIEFFTVLQYLSCFINQLTSLDVSKNTALTELYCENNQLTSLDVSKNTALTRLNCWNNQLASLDVSKNTALEYLRCSYNQLTSLDVSKNTELTQLNCSSNQIKGDKMQALVNSLPTVTKGYFFVIDTKNSKEQNVCTKDQVAIAKGKGWTVYDFNNGSQKEYAGSEGIAINATNFPDEIFRDVVAGTDIDKDADGYLSDEEIAAVTQLDVREKGIQNLKGIEFFTGLKELLCPGNELTSLDVSKNTELTRLACGQNQIKSLDLSKNTKMENLHCANNQLTALDVSMMPNLWRLYCLNNKLTKLDVTKNPKLEILYCDENKLTKLDITKNPLLTELFCRENQLTSLDVSKNTALKKLYCRYNQLTSLDVSKNTALENLCCDNNQLTSLDVSKNTALIDLYCNDNQLTSLDVSKNTALEYLHFENNQLSSIDLSKNTALIDLRCENNQLRSLDVSKNTALRYLYCHGNQIKEDQMLSLVNSLPTVTNGKFYVIDTTSSNEQNVCTKPQVKIATDKGWKVLEYYGGYYYEYEGSEPSAVSSIEVSAEEKGLWHSLDGKRLSGEPTKKGIYVRNGRKVVVK